MERRFSCIGGIRCERATALLNQMSTVNDQLKPKGVYHCRGGIERYIQTFPEGGFWKGKNYLFDRRMEQTPSIKGTKAIESDVDSKCCLCRMKWTVYRGQHKCNRSLCRVPVIVCESCTPTALEKPEMLVCDLCREGYRAPTEMPDLVSLKRKADDIFEQNDNASPSSKTADCEKGVQIKKPKVYYKDRLFLSRVPLTASFSKVKDTLGRDKVVALKWLTDRGSGGFYGSCILLMSSADDMRQVLNWNGQSNSKQGMGIKIDNKRIKVAKVFMKYGEGELFGKDFVQQEYPPIGTEVCVPIK